MDPNLIKIAHDAPGVLLEGARITRKLAQDNVDLHTENEALRHELTINKLAMRMHERGLESSLSLAEKATMLGGVPVDKLAALEAAIEMSAGGFKLATLFNPDEVSSATPSSKLSHGELGSSEQYSALDESILNLR